MDSSEIYLFIRIRSSALEQFILLLSQMFLNL